VSGPKVVIRPTYTPKGYASPCFVVTIENGEHSVRWPVSPGSWGLSGREAEDLAKNLVKVVGGVVVKEKT
jgi:hypothetical protein